ncbi:MAG: preprotein translocase subunit SecY, partial [Solirubrobacteraceae bacterium]
MLSRFGNIFRVPDLRNKVLFTLTIIALYQVGANVPVPGVSWAALTKLEQSAGSSGVLGFLNLFSGGALVRLAIFGLGVMPYITATIIVQL